MAAASSIIAGGGALLGAASGSQASQGSTTSGLTPDTALGRQSAGLLRESLTEFESLIGQGATGADVAAGAQSQRDLASLLEQFAGGGFLPTAEDQATARQFTSDIFAPERLGLQQRFEEEERRTAQLAAQLGRPTDDPILQAKLAQESTRQQAQLGARETAFAAQQAQQLPLQRLGFQEQLAGVRQGLASQALINRQTLFNLGSQAKNISIATRGGVSTSSKGGGFGGAVGGALAGAGGGLEAAGDLGLFSSGKTTDTATKKKDGTP
jgi:hypothetical protein